MPTLPNQVPAPPADMDELIRRDLEQQAAWRESIFKLLAAQVIELQAIRKILEGETEQRAELAQAVHDIANVVDPSEEGDEGEGDDPDAPPPRPLGNQILSSVGRANVEAEQRANGGR